VKTEEPIFNAPAAVVWLIALLVAVHIGRSLLSPDTDAWFVYAAAFIPARYNDMLGVDLPGGEVARFTSVITHMFVHGDLTHLALNSLWLLAFGGAIAKRTGAVRFFAFSLLCGVAGAGAFYIFNVGLLAPVIGASGAVSGLMGGTMRFLFPAMESGGFRQLREDPRSVRLMPLAEALTDRRVQVANLVFVLINVLAMFGLGGAQNSAGIAWEAHLGGYAAGFLLFGFFDRTSDEALEFQPSDD
jgi:membrane associated rhomboid family serine protease